MPVSIAGMHRSGTSMVARALHEAGLFLGDDAELMPPGIDNPEGYWEHAEIVALNDAILAELGGAWDLPPDPPSDWAAPRFDGLRSTAAALVDRFAGREPWGWKDPRNTLTVPFWRSVVGPLRVVGVVRNPLEVALSLQKRNQFSLALGLWLWYAYNKRLRDDVPPVDLVVTHFDAYFGSPTAELRRVLAAVGLPHDDARLGRLGENARAGLKHHTFAISDLLQANVAPEVIDLYKELCDLAGHPVGARPVHRSAAPSGATGPTTVVGRVDLWFFEQQQRLAELRIHQLARQELDGRVAERDGMIMEREGKIADRDSRLADRDRTIERLTREIGALRQTVADQTEQIASLSEQAATMIRHEAEQRDLLARAHNQLLSRDLEILGTLGGALARVAPGAPAAIYYRRLLERLREAVARAVPSQAHVLVMTYGDPAMLDLGRPATDFPQADDGVPADYTDADNAAAIAQLEELRAGGAAYLIVPSPAQSWLARQRELERSLDATFPAVVRELGLCTIYDLQASTDAALVE